MREAIKYFVGEHDFTSFCKCRRIKEDKIRTIYEASIKIEKQKYILLS